MVEAQQWLADNYKNKDDTIEIRIDDGIELDGKLIIDNYLKLKNIFLDDTKGITGLKFDNCPNVEVIFISDNKITEIEGLANLTKLRKLSFGDNNIKKIDISQNEQLEMLVFFNNPKDLEFVNGIKNLSKLFFLNSNNTFAVTKLLEQASGEDLKEIAGELKLNIEGKTLEEIKKIIKDEVAKIEQNKTKLNKEFSNLISDKNEVDDAKLEEIKNNIGKGEKYQKLVDETTNAPIVDKDKKEIDQTKLTDQLEKAADYEKLVNDNKKDLVTDDGKKIDQEKIEDLRNANSDAMAAIVRLGVNDLKTPTLEAKLGEGINLSDIPTTLKDLLVKIEKLEGVLNSVGINPNDTNVEKQLKEWKLLEKRVRAFIGKNYKEQLKIEEETYQNQIEVNTNN